MCVYWRKTTISPYSVEAIETLALNSLRHGNFPPIAVPEVRNPAHTLPHLYNITVMSWWEIFPTMLWVFIVYAYTGMASAFVDVWMYLHVYLIYTCQCKRVPVCLGVRACVWVHCARLAKGGWYLVAKSRQIEFTYDQVELVRSPPAQFVQVLVFCLWGGCPRSSKTSSESHFIHYKGIN